ncbi:DUF4238 domain-containing protein [Saccharothrix sp. BKS2]|uniref:DUF4238 domain-containing protein n=1 Tax=Saccharothrix sp. BKS2 TaxID=3064400 RepID=UPI0039ECF38C
MSTNDHTVPRMYLKRFGRQHRPRSKNWFVRAREVDRLDDHFDANIKNLAAVTDFYVGTNEDGVPHHKVERLLGVIESGATPVFASVLDDPDYALPARWPLHPLEREHLAWWIAAQLLRTVRQRQRIEHITGNTSDRVRAPGDLRSQAGRNEHLRFMLSSLEELTWIVLQRPWGLGFSDMCLVTSDVPVVIVNGVDDNKQLLAASYWDLILPLDPHRFLWLPGLNDVREDPRKGTDHLIHMAGGMGAFLSQLLVDAAHRHVFCHPDHDPVPTMPLNGPRLPQPWEIEQGFSAPSYIMEYAPLPLRYRIERRWLDHPER